MILAPLRGVTTRCFRSVFGRIAAEAGFDEAFTPFIPAASGFDPLKDRELLGPRDTALPVTPQFIGKDPAALRSCLARVRDAGFAFADLNAGCPFPMVRRKGRGSGLLRNPDLLARMLEAGCETMGEGRFSLKTRLGVESPDELLGLMPVVNRFPLRFLVVHARTAVQMYSGACDMEAFARVAAASEAKVVRNGDVPFPPPSADAALVMVGRPFVRSLASRPDSEALLAAYAEASMAELGCERPVLGRLKELVSYWRCEGRWERRWRAAKLATSLDEFLAATGAAQYLARRRK